MSNKVDGSTRGVPDGYFSQAQDLCRDFEVFDADGNNLLTQEELERAAKDEELTEAQRANAAFFGDDANVAPVDQFEHKGDKCDQVIGRGDIEKFTGGQVGKDARGEPVDLLKLLVGSALLYDQRGLADTAQLDASGKALRGPDGLISQGDVDALIERTKNPLEKELLQYVRKNFSLLDQLQNPGDAKDGLIGFGDLRTLFGFKKDPESEF